MKRRRRNRVVPDTPDRRAHREAVATVARLQRKLAEARAKMALVARRNIRKVIVDFNVSADVPTLETL